MARKPDNFDLLTEMREDIILCYRELAPECLWQKSVWRKIALHPAKRFYITPKQAYQKINYWLNGRPEDIDNLKKPLQRQLYYDLIKVVLDLAQKPENVGKSLKRLCALAVYQPAPRFYVTENYIRIIFSKVIHNEYTEDGHDIWNALRNRAYRNNKRLKKKR